MTRRARGLWDEYWTRDAPGRATTPAELRVLYRLWLVALLLKVLGSSWDVSWHFRWLRDDLAPPHLLNTAGTALVVALVIFQSYTGYGVDRATLRLMQAGIGLFLVAVPADVVNHRVNGLDITSWSPTHALLYLGTAVMLLGALRGWWRAAPPGRERTLVLGALWLFFLENVLFPSQHQEYGVLEIASWDRGRPYAEPSLLQFAAQQIGRPVDRTALVHFALPVPTWVYPLWVSVVGMGVLVATRLLLGSRFGATALAGCYVGYRCLMSLLLHTGGFPPSAVPVLLLAGGVAVDLVVLSRLPALPEAFVGGVTVTAAVYSALALQGTALAAPPADYASAPVAATLLTAVWFGLGWLVRRRRPPLIPTAAAPGTATR